MKWLVTGGRNYQDVIVVERTLTSLLLDCPDKVSHLINGMASGLDAIARAWAIKRGIQPVDCPALWDFYPHKGPKNAGSRRNAAMLQLDPDCVIAFPGGDGTANMVSQTRIAIETVGYPSKLIEVRADGTYRQFPAVR